MCPYVSHERSACCLGLLHPRELRRRAGLSLAHAVPECHDVARESVNGLWAPERQHNLRDTAALFAEGGRVSAGRTFPLEIRFLLLIFLGRSLIFCCHVSGSVVGTMGEKPMQWPVLSQ